MKLLLNKKLNNKNTYHNTIHNCNDNIIFTCFYLGDIGLINNNIKYIINLILEIINTSNKLNKQDKYIISLLGDNFYPYGVNCINDSRWIGFNNIFSILKYPIYPVLGNHDYILNPNAQIEYTKNKKSNINWNMDDFYYHKNINLSNCNIDFIFLDTQILAPEYAPNINTEIIESKHNKKIIDLQLEQINWLKKVLDKCKNKIIVQGHYPLYTNGIYDNCDELIGILMPFFEKYNVILYVCGHEHNIQYIEKKINSSNYIFRQIISGSSSYLRNDVNNNLRNENVIFIKEVGFFSIQFYLDKIRINCINNRNNLLLKRNIYF